MFAGKAPLLHCGLCSAVCPAGCVGGDKSRCVSALTQKKGVLSDTERAIIKDGGYAWGCDRCALVCPMNDGIAAEYKKFFTEDALDVTDFSDVAALSGEEYKKYPFSWRKRDILRRNFDILSDKGAADD